MVAGSRKDDERHALAKQISALLSVASKQKVAEEFGYPHFAVDELN